MRYSSPSRTSKTSASRTGSRRRRRLTSPRGVDRKSSSEKRADTTAVCRRVAPAGEHKRESPHAALPHSSSDVLASQSPRWMVYGSSGVISGMSSALSVLPLAVLDLVGIEHGETPAEAIRGAVGIAQAVERAGYGRLWVSEHHNMKSLACSAPELLIGHLASQTETLRVGAAGIMLPNHAAFKVAELFRTLLAMHPGRIDLAVGRAPGTDPLTAHVLRRGLRLDPAAEFPTQVAELLAFLGEGFPEGHPYESLIAAPVVDERPEVFVLGSSAYGPKFAAVNGLRAVFAHHMSPELAVGVLREYRRDFTPRVEGDAPYSAMSVLAFASDDEQARREFEA